VSPIRVWRPSPPFSPSRGTRAQPFWASGRLLKSLRSVFGQTLGVSLSGAIVQARVKTALESALAGRPDAGDLVERIRTDITTIADLPSDVREIATTAYSGALRLLWWFVLGAAVVSTLACVVIPQHELSTRGPLEQEEEEE
jgi:hypothetical protein